MRCIHVRTCYVVFKSQCVDFNYKKLCERCIRYEQCIVQISENPMKILFQDYTFIKRFYGDFQHFRISFRYYYHYFILRLQVEV